MYLEATVFFYPLGYFCIVKGSGVVGLIILFGIFWGYMINFWWGNLLIKKENNIPIHNCTNIQLSSCMIIPLAGVYHY